MYAIRSYYVPAILWKNMDDKRTQNIRPKLTECLKTLNFQDIISEKRKVAIDLDNIYKHGVIDFVEFLEEFPNEGIELLEECYSDAYYAIKTEKPDIVITVKNIPEKFNLSEKKQAYTIEDVKSGTLGKLIEFEGIVVVITSYSIHYTKLYEIYSPARFSKRTTQPWLYTSYSRLATVSFRTVAFGAMSYHTYLVSGSFHTRLKVLFSFPSRY